MGVKGSACHEQQTRRRWWEKGGDGPGAAHLVHVILISDSQWQWLYCLFQGSGRKRAIAPLVVQVVC